MYDWPDSVQSINEENLHEWGVTVYEALEAAMENLDESTSTMGKIGESLYFFMAADSYDAARIMLVDRIKALELDGEPVAMVPNRDKVLITGSNDDIGLQMMVDLATKWATEAYPLSGSPLILRDGEWVDWMPPPEISRLWAISRSLDAVSSAPCMPIKSEHSRPRTSGVRSTSSLPV